METFATTKRPEVSDQSRFFLSPSLSLDPRLAITRVNMLYPIVSARIRSVDMMSGERCLGPAT